MSIRLRFTLLYNVILALTLAVFGVALYSIQARTTYQALKQDILRTSEMLHGSFLRMAREARTELPFFSAQPPPDRLPPMPFEDFSTDQAFQELPEREIVRLLDSAGNLVASPFGRQTDALPFSPAGLETLQNQGDWWETASFEGQSMLIYSRPVSVDGNLTFILQVARPLTERNRSLQALGVTLVVASLVTLLAAFGIGWVLSGITLGPIQRITQIARAIGKERDLTRRVDYQGPQDEVGQLATTFNSMLARLQEAYQRLAHSLEMQRAFVADVSHELRTPLTTLRGNLGLLRRDPPIPADERSDILDDMVEESDRLIRLVNDLLILAHADAGRNLSMETIEIFPLLEESCRQVRPLLPQKSPTGRGRREARREARRPRRVTLQTPPDLAILGDRDAFKQVLLIGLDNAIKHSSGDIEVSAELVRQGESVEIRIRDHGPGIPPEKLEQVFDRFYRGEELTTLPGYGLGLAIAKVLVEGQGGTIEMQSELGAGSVLVLRFPTSTRS